MILYRMKGTTIIARIVGTDEATSHDTNEMLTPYSLAIAAPSGLPAMAVSQRAEESVRLAIPENIRKRPRRLRSSRSGVAPAASAIENTSGNSTPERAVLLGNAGEISASTPKMLYESPSVERPKTLIAW